MTTSAWPELSRVDGGKAGRYYIIPDGRQARSVTRIMDCMDKPNVDRWKVSVERTAVIEAAADLYIELHGAERMERMVYREALRGRLGLNKEHERRSAKAAETGSEVHDLVAWNLRREMGIEQSEHPPVLSPAGQPCFAAFEQWRAEQSLKVIAVEQMVFHPEALFAGTLDTVLEHPEAGLGIGDWKTSNALYPEMGLQVAAYAKAVDLMGRGPVQWGLVVRLPKVGVFNPATHSRFYFKSELDALYEEFLHVVAIDRWLNGTTA